MRLALCFALLSACLPQASPPPGGAPEDMASADQAPDIAEAIDQGTDDSLDPPDLDMPDADLGPGPRRWATVSIGGTVSCALTTEDELFCWGSDVHDIVSNASTIQQPVHAVASSDTHVCAVNGDAEVVCWGLNDEGQATGVSSTATTPTVVSVGIHPPSLRATYRYNCAIDRQSNRPVCWGNNVGEPFAPTGEAPSPPTPREMPDNVVLVAPSLQAVISIDGDRKLGTWGRAPVQPTCPIGNHCPFVELDGEWTHVAGGSVHACAIDAAGLVGCWGSNLRSASSVRSGKVGRDVDLQEQPDPPTNPVNAIASPWQDLAAGLDHTCGLSNGDIYCWGDNRFGQLARPEDVETSLTPEAVTPTPPATFTSVHAHGSVSCGLTQVGELYCWGLNTFNLIDDTAEEHKRTPVLIPLPPPR